MGVFDKAKGALIARKAYQTYLSAVELANKDQPESAKAKYQDALGQYADAARLGGATANTLLSYALLLLREGETEKSKAVMQDIARQPNLPDDARFQLRITYAIMLWRTGRLDEAIATIRRAADMKKNGAVYSALGMFLVDKARETGSFDEALAFNREALDYDDEDGDVLDNMGQLLEAMAEDAAAKGSAAAGEEYLAQAKDYYVRAHEQRPRQITTIYYLARIYLREGDRASALKLVDQAQKLYYSDICPISRDMMEALRQEIQES